MARAAITARRRLQRLLVHPVGKRPSSNSRRIGRPAAPTGMSASKPGRPRRRPPSIISRSRLQRKGPASGPFLIYCNPGGAQPPGISLATRISGRVNEGNSLGSTDQYKIMDLITLHGTLAIAPLAMISAEDRHLVRFPRLGKVAVLCEPCNYVRRLAINPHTSRMTTAPTMLPMKPAP